MEFPTKKLARRAAEERLRSINSLTYRPTVEGNFARFTEQWIRDVLSQKKFSSQTTERSRINNHLLPAFAPTRCMKSARPWSSASSLDPDWA